MEVVRVPRYVYLSGEPVAWTSQVMPDVLVDFDDAGQVVGLEFLDEEEPDPVVLSASQVRRLEAYDPVR